MAPGLKMALSPVFSRIKLHWNIVTSIHLHIVYGTFVLQWQSRIVVTQTVFPAKPKMFTPGPLQERSAGWLLHWTSSVMYSLEVLIPACLNDQEEWDGRQETRRDRNDQKTYWENDNSTIPIEHLLNTLLGVQIENSMEAIWKRKRIFLVIGKPWFFFPLSHLQCIWALCLPLLTQPPVSSLRG